jgi:carboxyl-terminal processing protease
MKKILISFALALAVIGGYAQSTQRNLESAKQLQTLGEIYRVLELNYADTLNTSKIFDQTIKYMLYQLDPYTNFYTPKEADEFREQNSGKYGGIGSIISFHEKKKRCIISRPYAGMPAAKAGLRCGDVIMAIDGKEVPTADMSNVSHYSDSVSKCLRGEPGTKFRLSVQRVGENKLLHFDIERATITMSPVVYAKMRPDSIAVIMLDDFGERAARDMAAKIEEYERQGMRGLVLDLRGNGGGLISEAVKIVNMFLPRGKEVTVLRGKNVSKNYVYRTENSPINEQVPIVVLVNSNSASASEITAGALQDYDRAVIMGQNTYGKGLVQTTTALPGEALLKYTESKYYIPSGRCVQAYNYEDGQPKILPDSLAKTFYTKNGRPVRDCGGIQPDIVLPKDSLPNLLIYLSMSNLLQDYVALYHSKHKTIAPADEFKLTDQEYDKFVAFLKENQFTYDQQSLKMLETLKKLAKFEGYGETSKAEFDALEAKLKHNEDADYKYWKNNILDLVESSIAADYYYQEGEEARIYRTDKDLAKAIALLKNKEEYERILKPAREQESKK